MDGKKYCYQRIMEYIIQNIETNKYSDFKIESENELCSHFHTTRMTVRKALSLLQVQGYIYTVPKKGSYVASEKLIKELDGLRSFSEDMMYTSGSYSKVIHLEKVENPTNQLISDKVWYIARLRYSDDEVIAYEEGYFDSELIENLTNSILEKSIYDYIENTLKTPLMNASQEISAVLCPVISGKLGVNQTTPLLKISQQTYLYNNRCIEVCDTYYTGEKYTFKQNAKRRKRL